MRPGCRTPAHTLAQVTESKEAYRVPFALSREHAPHYRLMNLSLERLRGVTFQLAGPGILAAPSLTHLAPGADVWIAVHGRDLAESTALIVRWLRQDGAEYLWRVSF